MGGVDRGPVGIGKMMRTQERFTAFPECMEGHRIGWQLPRTGTELPLGVKDW